MNITAINLAGGKHSPGAEATVIRERRRLSHLQQMASALGTLRLGTGSAVRMVQDWWRLRRSDAHFHSLNDRMLRDIGIRREEIGKAVHFCRDSLD